MGIKVLLVEDDRSLREALADTLLLAGHDFHAVGSAEEALTAVAREAFSLVISDVNMPGMDGHQLLSLLRARQPQLPVLLMTAHGAVERAVDAMRQGAADYLVKPFEPKALLDLVSRHALGSIGATDVEGPIAVEPASAQLLELSARVARSDSTVLISGESGTGKEVLARYIHQQSHRATQPFIAINCAAIPDNMLEATLFGHEKGSFTGAIAAQPGKFEQADGGTILLDEISEMPLGLQAKLLRVLQEREVERVGGRKPITLDIRVVATTNRDLAAEVAAGRFREDLFYRLSVFPLAWRPLRERTADILPLAERLLAKHVNKMKHAAAKLSPEAQACLTAYPWPGNVRELDNAIQRALILQQGGVIQPQDFCLAGPVMFAALPVSVPTPAVIREVEIDADSAGALGDDLRRREFQMIIDTLRSERGRRKEAAEKLGISPRTLRYKLAQMRDAGMDVEGYLFAT
ncbi:MULTISPECIES: sigma-54-dependent response regulator transcription factor FleR [Pseudomonas]|uniref:sigma-54-dependent response regulator transcription factor FleR n=1 Tax=Pseudomonas TaxID=286 RepID=UPI0012419428|nr:MULTISPECIES: sigma-54-dependent response regulator transcription factor FleR [Pseudomonas]MBP5944720.1 sigma-54-dependent response regulator transcription factor FleR [Pseudomonas sp. P9(2020)]MBP5956827.1 sigma-54-dependent response regulator transcription factor FleR [Pseudomonas anatoliensis]MBZ9561271.1 sigma-54-dependent response regulator transcription factor FleR [Pseudomonas sp. P116]VVP49706.1 Regulatory protein AtoC [Pseudomonas fluorescens]